MRIKGVVLSVVLTLLLAGGVTYLLAFNPPTQPPPGGSGAIAVDTNGNLSVVNGDFSLNSNVSERVLNTGIQRTGAGSVLWYGGTLKIKTGSTGLTGDRVTINTFGDVVAKGRVEAGKIAGQARAKVLLADSNGECTNTVNGQSIKISRGIPPVTWEGAAAACPAGWWVCSAEERGTQACGNTTTTRIYFCRADYGDIGPRFNSPYNKYAWIADATVAQIYNLDITVGALVDINGGSPVSPYLLSEDQKCIRYPVWCCSYNN